MKCKELVEAVGSIATYDGKTHSFFVTERYYGISQESPAYDGSKIVYSASIVMSDVGHTIKGRGSAEDVIAMLRKNYHIWKAENAEFTEVD